MAFDPLPPAWIDSWSEDGTNITIPLASFPEMTAGEADATTGDVRKVLYAICEKLWVEWSTRASADLPTKMTISRASTVNEATDAVTKRYTFTFVTEATSTEVVNE